jgi:PPM family protein phosphatase
VTLGIVEEAGATQTGNVRRSNEDSYLMRSPLFVVADGMGGAKAGEIASRMAAEAFAEVDLVGTPACEALEQTIRTANARILERSRSDPEAAGMGTTVTAAIMEGGTITFAHVGDSRAYLLRDGGLQRLSDDHSLVGELVRKGELSETEAEHHPQRSVITRALGTDDAVEIDTFSLRARDGDVVLLCSDGLNTMVPEATIATLLAADEPAATIARNLTRAALAGGGEDNVTAVVFRVGEVSEPPVGAAEDRADHILPSSLDQDDEDDGRGPGLRTALALVGIGALAIVLAAGAIVGLRESHFIGADTGTGRVAVYQGVPFDLPLGIHLYHVVYESTVSYATLTPRQRQTLFDHTLRTQSGAMKALHPYEVASP